MASSLANRPLLSVGIVILATSFAFVAVNQYLSRTQGTPLVVVPAIVETPPEKTARLGREQSGKDWGVAQKRADARDAEGRTRHQAPDPPVTPP